MVPFSTHTYQWNNISQSDPPDLFYSKVRKEGMGRIWDGMYCTAAVVAVAVAIYACTMHTETAFLHTSTYTYIYTWTWLTGILTPPGARDSV